VLASDLVKYSTLKIESVRSSETSLNSYRLHGVTSHTTVGLLLICLLGRQATQSDTGEEEAVLAERNACCCLSFLYVYIEQVGVAVMPLACIWEMLGSDFCRYTGCPEDFRVFSQSLQESSELVPQLGRFRSFKFVIHVSSYHSTLSVATGSVFSNTHMADLTH
jgi:hypothetical protein